MGGGELDEVGLLAEAVGGAVPAAGCEVFGGEEGVWVGEVVRVGWDAGGAGGGGGDGGEVWGGGFCYWGVGVAG